MAENVQKPNEIRFSVFYEKNSNKDTSLIYKEGVPMSPEQEKTLGVAFALHPSPVTQSLYLNIAALKSRYGIDGAVKGFDVILIPRK